jgi:uncharacterized damage-inducible protein DinB
MSSVAAIFTREAAGFLRDTYLARMRTAVETLPAADLWWRPHEGALCVGQILRHLEGNMRQWILSGLAGAPDARERAAEFAGEAAGEAAELLARYEATLREAATVIEALDDAALCATHAIQGFRVSGLSAVLHVVEHVSWHTGQAVWIAKARAGAAHGIAFYDDAAIDRARNG